MNLQNLSSSELYKLAQNAKEEEKLRKRDARQKEKLEAAARVKARLCAFRIFTAYFQKTASSQHWAKCHVDASPDISVRADSVYSYWLTVSGGCAQISGSSAVQPAHVFYAESGPVAISFYHRETDSMELCAVGVCENVAVLEPLPDEVFFWLNANVEESK